MTPRRHSHRHEKCGSASVRRRSSVKGRNRRRLVVNLARSDVILHNVVTRRQRGDRKPHRGQGSRQDDQRSEARRSDSNDRPRRTTEAQRDRQRQAEGDGSSRNNRGERRQSGPSSHRKGRRLASVVRLRAVTARSSLGLALQVVADKPCCNATSEHRAHHETSALR